MLGLIGDRRLLPLSRRAVDAKDRVRRRAGVLAADGGEQSAESLLVLDPVAEVHAVCALKEVAHLRHGRLVGPRQQYGDDAIVWLPLPPLKCEVRLPQVVRPPAVRAEHHGANAARLQRAAYGRLPLGRCVQVPLVEPRANLELVIEPPDYRLYELFVAAVVADEDVELLSRHVNHRPKLR